MSEWETIIGLEIHAELNTRTKLFSSAPNRFGDEPNTNITEVCTGQPGALPILNAAAVHKAVQFGCAINSDVQLFSKFDRKSYFYPDSPRNFQITQFDEPIILGGTIITEMDGEEKHFQVTRAHLEDDAGTLKHFSSCTGSDYNRAGVPLIEIVSEPCIHSADEAVAYATMVRAILEYTGVSDCNMEEGSLRFDVNISVRKKGETELRNRTEIKNLNSFTHMHLAIVSETKRQIEVYEKGDEIPQATYRFDVETQQTKLMRRKESSDDYRYFPEPDLPPIVLTESYINEVRESLPELPLERERRYIKELGLSHYNAFILTSDKHLSDYFETGLESCSNARSLCNWMTVEFTGRGVRPPAEHVAQLVGLIDDGTITGKIAKKVADEMALSPEKSPLDIVESNPDYKPLNDSAEIETLVNQVLSEHPQSIIDFKNGKDRAFGFLVGQVMKLSRGKASPDVVNNLLKEKIK